MSHFGVGWLLSYLFPAFYRSPYFNQWLQDVQQDTFFPHPFRRLWRNQNSRRLRCLVPYDIGSEKKWGPNCQKKTRGNCNSFPMDSLPILDTLQKITNSLLVNVDIPINTKSLKDYTHIKIDLGSFNQKTPENRHPWWVLWMVFSKSNGFFRKYQKFAPSMMGIIDRW